MTDNKPFLEITLQLVNGTKLRFKTSDIEHGLKIITGVNPQKIFLEPRIKLFGDLSLTTIPTSAIAWMIFTTSAEIHWKYPLHFHGAEVLSKEDFRKFLSGEAAWIKKALHSEIPGKEIHFYIEMITRDSFCWHLRVKSETLMPMEKIQIPKVLSDISAFHAMGPDGGALLINMKNVVSTVVYPGPMDPPAAAWKMKPC